MKRTLFGLLILGLTACSKPSETLYMPAEWEPHDAIWLGWSKYTSFHPVAIDIIKSLTPHVQIKVAASSDSLLQVAKHIISEQGLDTTTIRFHTFPGDRYWIRDYGAAFLVNETGDLGVADFVYNLNGKPQWLEEKYDNNPDSLAKYIDPNIYKKARNVDSLMSVAENAQIIKSKLIHEGGAIEVNGKGSQIANESTIFYRNPEWSKKRVEEEFKRVLGVNNIIWMKKGLADDPQSSYRRIVDNYVGSGTGGHTDEFVRFADATTIMLAWVGEEEKELNPINQMNYERMKENYDILIKSKDQDGNPFKIIKVPLPDLITKQIIARNYPDSISTRTLDLRPSSFKPSEAPQLNDSLLRVPATSYLNYLVTNGVVILPSYVHMGSSSEKEEKVREIFEKQFPDREIKFIDAMPINWYGGGIHCSTQQQPRRKK